MCEACKEMKSSVEMPRKRPTLGELNPAWHCTIVGTCLSMADLRSVAAKVNLRFPKAEPPSDYDLHAGLVRMIPQEKVVAKLLHKLLDRKYALALGRFKRATSVADLEDLWVESLSRGEVAGACWALMSHAAASEDLRSTIFGEIHMLSHQVGASARADIRRLHALEKEKQALETKIRRQQERMAAEIGGRETIIRELRQRLDQEIAETRRLGHAAEAASEMVALRALVGELQRHLALESEGRRVAETATREAERHAMEQAAELVAVRGELDSAHDELAAVEGRLADGTGSCSRECRRLDLCGRCILFVGGRSNHVPHLRRLVEECNGTLVHHDGGFEDGMGRLSGLMGQADAVLFPVDCVSHMAHDHLKRLCKRWEKPFVPVRRSGLGAFMRALESVGQEDGDAAN